MDHGRTGVVTIDSVGTISSGLSGTYGVISRVGITPVRATLMMSGV